MSSHEIEQLLEIDRSIDIHRILDEHELSGDKMITVKKIKEALEAAWNAGREFQLNINED